MDNPYPKHPCPECNEDETKWPCCECGQGWGKLTEFSIPLALAMGDVVTERERQDELKALGRFAHTLNDADCPDPLRLQALVEEIGEVARALQTQDTANLKEELTQVAALAVAWLEYLIGQDNGRD